MSDDRRGDEPFEDRDEDFGDDPADDAPLTDEVPDERRAESRGVRRGVLIGIGAAIVVAAIVAVVVFVWKPWAATDAPPDNTVAVTELPDAAAPAPSLTANPAPPTTAAPAPGDSVLPQPSGASGIDVALNRWNWVANQQMISVGGFVAVDESGGTCTLTATHGDTTLQAQADATPDVNTTTCVVNLHAPNAASGDWQLTMTYDGPSGTGSSGAVTLNIP